MGKKTSVYLTDSVSEAIETSGVAVSTAIRIGAYAQPRVIWPPEDGRGFITWWFCDPPPMGSQWKAIRDGWHYSPDRIPILEIYEIELTS